MLPNATRSGMLRHAGLLSILAAGAILTACGGGSGKSGDGGATITTSGTQVAQAEASPASTQSGGNAAAQANASNNLPPVCPQQTMVPYTVENDLAIYSIAINRICVTRNIVVDRDTIKPVNNAFVAVDLLIKATPKIGKSSNFDSSMVKLYDPADKAGLPDNPRFPHKTTDRLNLAWNGHESVLELRNPKFWEAHIQVFDVKHLDSNLELLVILDGKTKARIPLGELPGMIAYLTTTAPAPEREPGR